ncbi:hypothetical protein D9758_008155 [Tetrapyrgos nigripes]|uniref:Peptidase C14 caspase domain-containing protein n=1 Tax=Tetrapyrgos nigripes TaxID=182062 RepID=A0A8H5GHA9_9AGAR|nr:hypothetical protein D9758_008155 [Tetrapyrgos nigripes]
MGRPPTLQELYSGTLYSKGHGCALLKPERPQIGTQPIVRDVYVGDVGLVDHKNGLFIPLFNIFESHIQTYRGVPAGFASLEFHEDLLVTATGYFKPGTRIMSKNGQETMVDLSGSVLNPGLPMAPGMSVHFQFVRGKGSLLLLPNGATRVDYRGLECIRAHAMENADAWYEYAEQLGETVPDGSLYVITGFDRAKCYKNAAFLASSTELAVSVTLSCPILSNNSFGELSVTSRPLSRVLHDWKGMGSSEEENLYVFLRGFKIMTRRRRSWRRKFGTELMSLTDNGKLKDLLYQGEASRSLPSLFASPGPASSPQHGSISPKNANSTTSSSESNNMSPDQDYFRSWSPVHSTTQRSSVSTNTDDTGLISHSSTEGISFLGSDEEFESDVSEFEHPSDIINKYILEKCNASVAITHDSEWSSVLEEVYDELPEKATLISLMLTKFPSKFKGGKGRAGGAVCLGQANEDGVHDTQPQQSCDAVPLPNIPHSEPVSNSTTSLNDGHVRGYPQASEQQQEAIRVTRSSEIVRYGLKVAGLGTEVTSSVKLDMDTGRSYAKDDGQLARSASIRISDLAHVDAKPKSKKRALLVGISYNKGLKGPHKDVIAMRSLLIEKYDYLPDDIVVLVDDRKEKSLQPTKANLFRELEKLIDDAKRGDHFFFHYAGHVVQGQEDPNSPEEDRREEYIVPCDAREPIALQDCIQDDTLKELLVKRLPVGAHLVAVFDSCHSQSLLDLEHFRSNRVYVPWISKGRRKSDSMWNDVQRKQAILRTRTIHQTKRLTEGKVKSRRTSVDQVQLNITANINPKVKPVNATTDTSASSSSTIGSSDSTSTPPSLTSSISYTSQSSQSSARPYMSPMTPVLLMTQTPRKPGSVPLTPIITGSRSSLGQGQIPTVPNPPTTLSRAATVTFSNTPLQKLNQRASRGGSFDTILGLVRRSSRSPSPTPSPNQRRKSMMTATKKRQSLSTLDSLYTPFTPCFKEDPLPEHPDPEGIEPEPRIVESPVQGYCSGDCRKMLGKAIEERNGAGAGAGAGCGHGHGHSAHGHECEGSGSQDEGMGEVISLLSCRDNQLAWEDADGTSMTQVLVKQLRKQTHPSMKDLMANISHELHKAAVVMHSSTKTYKKSMVIWRKKNQQPIPRGSTSDTSGLEMSDFQDPQLSTSSRKPFNMERPWNM